jgi:PAS domain S-box-containing protein
LDWQPDSYLLALSISALFSGIVAVYAWWRRSMPGAVPLALFMLAAAEWSVTYALEASAPGLSGKLFWARTQYFGIVLVAPMMLIMVLQYTNRYRWLHPRYLIAMAIVPILSLILVWTNDFHGLIWTKVTLPDSTLHPLDLEHGPFFWILVLHSYSLLALGTILLLRTFLRSFPLYRAQTRVMLIGTLAPWVGNFLYVADLNPFAPLDLTPIGFTFSGLAAAWGVFRTHFLDIVPIARDVVLENMSDGVIVLDTLDRIIDINPAAQQIVGVSSTEAIGQPAEHIFSSQTELVERFRNETDIQAQIAVGEEGTRQFYNLRISPLFDRNSSLSGRVLVLHETTELRRAELTLRQHQERLEAQNVELRKLSLAVEQSANTVVITDLAGNIEYVNPKFEETTGFTLQEVLGQNPRILKSGRQAPAYYTGLWQTITSGREWHGEFLNKRKDGTLYWEQATIAPIYDSAGDMTHFVAVKEDITERKQAEQALNKLLELSHALATTHDVETALARVVDAALQVVVDADESTIQWLDERDEKLNTIAFSKKGDAPRQFPSFRPGVGIAGRAFAAQRTINVPDVLADDRFLPGPSPIRFRSLLVSPLIVKDRALGTLSLSSAKIGAFSSTDRTLARLMADQIAAALENTLLLQELTQSVTELEERNEELDAFAHTVAHDLKNPLNSVVGYAEVLSEKHNSLPENLVQDFLRIIAENGHKMGTIITELLLLSSVRGVDDVETHPLEMGRIVLEARRNLGQLIDEYDAQLTLPESWPIAVGYGPWIEAVWTNLLSNAIKYGGRLPQVELGAEERTGSAADLPMVRFWVRDNGPGLSPEEQARLFTPFERLHQTRVPGHGLGLSIVQRVVTKLGGQVGVESDNIEGQGSTFYFTLPGLSVVDE